MTAGSLVPNLTSMVSSSDSEKLSPKMVTGTPPCVPPVAAERDVIFGLIVIAVTPEASARPRPLMLMSKS